MKMRAFILPIAALLSCGSANAQTKADCDSINMEYTGKEMKINTAAEADGLTLKVNPSKDQLKKICDVSVAALRDLASLKASVAQNRACQSSLAELLKTIDDDIGRVQDQFTMARCR